MANSFDTLEATKAFQEAGFEQKQAEVIVQQINGAIIGNVATKADIEQLGASTKADIKRLEASTRGVLERRQDKLHAEIVLVCNEPLNLKTYLDTKFEALEAEFKSLRTDFQSLRTEFKASQDRTWKIVVAAMGALLLLYKVLEEFVIPSI